MLCILQSRMSSKRLPGKMLMNLEGRVLIGRVIDRLAKAQKISEIVVATSNDPSDDAIEEFCALEKIKCYRGSLNNVSNRFMEVVIAEKVTSFVRINGDSPFMDPSLVDLAISYFDLGNCDLVTNVGIRTFPKGQSVEVILAETFIRECKNVLTEEQKEHVTKFFYDRPDKYRIVNFTSGGDYNSLNMCVDTLEDKFQVEAVLRKLDGDFISWKGLISFF